MRSNQSSFSSGDESSASAVTYTGFGENSNVGSTANPTGEEMPPMPMIPVNPQKGCVKGKRNGKGKGSGKNPSKADLNESLAEWQQRFERFADQEPDNCDEPWPTFQPHITSLLAPEVLQILSSHVHNLTAEDGTRLDELLGYANPQDHRIRRHLLMLFPRTAADGTGQPERFIDLPGFRPGDRYYIPDEHRNYEPENTSSSAAAPYQIRIEENDEEMMNDIDSNVGDPPLSAHNSDNESAPVFEEITDRQLNVPSLDFTDAEPTSELLRYGGTVLNAEALASLDSYPELWTDAVIYNLHVQVPNNFPMEETISLDGNVGFIPVSYAVDECTLIFRECRIISRS